MGIRTCATRKSDAAACRMSTIREDVLKERVCEALEIESFTPEAFQEKVDHITITGNGTMSISLKDGTSRDMDFSTKRKMPPASEETRQKRSAAMKARITPERRKQMSEHMKQLRKERGKNWRKT